jgi:hypothetical protein
MSAAMYRATVVSGALLLALALAPHSQAQEAGTSRMFVYPAKGQSQPQLDQDRYECHAWARQQSGFDPTSFNASQSARPAAPRVVPVAANPSAGATAKGTLAGAVVGGVIGSHNHDTLGGAVLGAAVGSIAGGTIETEGQRSVERDAQDKARQVASQRSAEQSALEQRKGDYRRAIAACLEARGYTVR